MEFDDKRSKETKDQFYSVRIQDIKPFTPLLGPAFLYMEINDRFVRVKNPLDFFSDQDLKDHRAYKNIYFYKNIERIVNFQEKGRKIRKVFGASYPIRKAGNSRPGSAQSQVRIQPGFPFEVSDAVGQEVKPLFKFDPSTNSPQIEIFPIVAFAFELCDFENYKIWVEARDNNVGLFEKSLYFSSWAVFVAILLDYCDLNFICDLQKRAILGVMNGGNFAGNDVEDLIRFSVSSVVGEPTETISLKKISQLSGSVAQKLADRIQHIVAGGSGAS